MTVPNDMWARNQDRMVFLKRGELEIFDGY